MLIIVMIGDKLIIKPYHLPPAREILKYLQPKFPNRKTTIAVGGESGCGKSTLAIALKEILLEKDIKAFIFHMDDYFFLPPTSNHNQRLEDINFVGPQEVNLELLQNQIDLVTSGQKVVLEKPLVHYKENEIRSETIDFDEISVLIIEGTYTMLLNVDFKIFIDRNFRETYQNRLERARDEMSPFVENVLEIEHAILQKDKLNADILIDKEYNVIENLR
jgi:uridine kinase